MYEQVSHSLLNDILNQIKPEISNQDLRHFYTRLGANFYAIHSLFEKLYGHRPDFEHQAQNLVETMARQYIQRPDHLRQLDLERERDYNWFLSQKWVGMLERATWLNYVRCHDDIGLGFDDRDIALCDYEPLSHRKFLIDYFTGQFEDSHTRGLTFGQNDKTGDARISGSLVSLVGLEHALEVDDHQAADDAIKIILLLHAVILSFGGIPLLYCGDALGTTNDDSYLDDPHKMGDSRWVHRPSIDWDKAARRNTPGTVEYKIFSALKRMIAVRKEIAVFADFNNRELLDVGNPHLFAFGRYNLTKPSERVLVIANFNGKPQHLALADIGNWAPRFGQMVDLCSGKRPEAFNGSLVIPGFGCYWLSEN